MSGVGIMPEYDDKDIGEFLSGLKDAVVKFESLVICPELKSRVRVATIAMTDACCRKEVKKA